MSRGRPLPIPPRLVLSGAALALAAALSGCGAQASGSAARPAHTSGPLRAAARTPAPHTRQLLELGKLISVSGRCTFTGPFTLVLANARHSATDVIRWRIGGGSSHRAQLDPERRLTLTVPVNRSRGNALTPVLHLGISQATEPHTITATARLRVALDYYGHHPDCTLVDAHVSATTVSH